MRIRPFAVAASCPANNPHNGEKTRPNLLTIIISLTAKERERDSSSCTPRWAAIDKIFQPVSNIMKIKSASTSPENEPQSDDFGIQSKGLLLVRYDNTASSNIHKLIVHLGRELPSVSYKLRRVTVTLLFRKTIVCRFRNALMDRSLRGHD